MNRNPRNWTWLAILVVLCLAMGLGTAFAAPGGGGGGNEKGGKKCADGVDNDSDNFIDCADDGCDATTRDDGFVCEYGTELTCNDGFDNDADGLTDGADPDCQAQQEICDDQTDNDGDGDIDCADSDCTGEIYCEYPEATCDDGFDNDGDSDVDCADSDCTGVPPCPAGPVPEDCDNSVDDDGDGLVDCDDYADCVQAVNCQTAGQNQFNILMNYELGMHCTGFEFAYCCVLPPYNSILAQVVKTDKNGGFPNTLEADHSVGLDFLGRPTVVRDKELDASGNFKKYMLRYWHDAQPRNDDPNGKPQSTTLISVVEGNSLLMWNTVFDAADTTSGNDLIYGDYNGAHNVLQGDSTFGQAEDNYANAWLNHFYIYQDLEGSNPTAGVSLEKDKIRLGLPNSNASTVFSTVVPDNAGPAFHPMGPGAVGGLDNVLTFSTDAGTVVFTQMKLLENLPVMLTSPRIWEALGLPLTPFEDTIDFFGDPGLVDEDSIRPYVAMKAQLHEADCVGSSCTPGAAVLDNGEPVIGFGTAPIDIPNCERCHSDFSGVNSAQNAGNNPDVMANVQLEIDFWNTYYSIDTGAGDSDWYSRLKGAAISILNIHDNEHGTHFMDNYPGTGFGIPQNYRLGHESVLCQRCHGDNVIAVVKSADCGPSSVTCADGDLIPPLTEAIHDNHRSISEGGNIDFVDSQGRDGGCQGCHPAHRSDGGLASYPITEDGSNAFAGSDNRDAAGGCFVGRDVHSNAMKDVDGVETPEHLNPVGQWLSANVFEDPSPNGPAGKGIWCTNCHQQFSQEMWKAENVASLIHAQPGDPGHVREPAGGTLADVVSAVNTALGTSYTTTDAIDWIDPGTHRTSDQTHRIWAEDPGLCDYVYRVVFGNDEPNPDADANVVTLEVNVSSSAECSTGQGIGPVDCGTGTVPFYICNTADGDGDPSVNVLDFCTTPDCVATTQATLPPNSVAVPVPFSAATDARDHWLAPGEPHCADCHAAPYTEQSGNITFYPPFNYPRKASLNRYTRGHQDITCQGCHESIHGLYPVTPPGMYGTKAIDTTSYAQAASHNDDASHGPLKCGACHQTNQDGVYVNPDNRIVNALEFRGTPIDNDFDAAVSWMHTYTEDVDPADYICQRCHGDNSALISSTNGKWTDHAFDGRVTRDSMDKAEITHQGWVSGDPAHEVAEDTVCKTCHGDRSRTLGRRGCTTKWKNHLVEGRVSELTWETVTANNVAGQPAADGTYCGW